jgi:hypothetical protein
VRTLLLALAVLPLSLMAQPFIRLNHLPDARQTVEHLRQQPHDPVDFGGFMHVARQEMTPEQMGKHFHIAPARTWPELLASAGVIDALSQNQYPDVEKDPDGALLFLKASLPLTLLTYPMVPKECPVTAQGRTNFDIRVVTRLKAVLDHGGIDPETPVAGFLKPLVRETACRPVD